MSTNTSSVIQLLETPLHDPHGLPVLYKVKAGDTLSKIIEDYYDIHHADLRYSVAEASVVYFNEKITDPNKIYTGQVLRLMPLASEAEVMHCEIEDDFSPYDLPKSLTRHYLEPLSTGYTHGIEQHLPTDPVEEELFWQLAWWDYAYPFLSNGSGGGTIALGGIVSQSNNMILQEVKALYEQYKSGAITKGQYDYGRRKALQQYKNLVGPFEKFIFKNQTAQQAMRIARTKALPATQNLDLNAARLGRLATLAKTGGVVLTAASLGVGCIQIANTEDQHEKNEIFVETAASAGFGLGAGAVVGILLFSNPVGWTVALVAGAAVAVGSYGAGKGFKAAYNNIGNEVDLVKLTGTDKICS